MGTCSEQVSADMRSRGDARCCAAPRGGERLVSAGAKGRERVSSA
jgi:hypothetical protein